MVIHKETAGIPAAFSFFREVFMEIQPILFGADMNCYGMARAFWEAAGVRSLAFGKYRLGATAFSRFVRYRTDRRMQTDEGRDRLLANLARRVPAGSGILLGCTDEYASYLIRRRPLLEKHFILPVPAPETLRYADKQIFQNACAERGILVPATVFLNRDDPFPSELPFAYPIVIKPSSSEEYWRFPFPGMRKVYFAAGKEDAGNICGMIRRSGYRGALLLQEMLTNRDGDNYVLTVYCNRSGEAQAAVFGHVLMEEHTPRGTGNHAVILTGEPVPPIGRQLISFLREIGYCGFANFDILRARGQDYVLEMNLRQGRSNHYMCAAGINPAMLILREYFFRITLPYVEETEENLWYSVPPSVVYSHVKDGALCARCRQYIETGKAFSPFHAARDLSGNLLRRIFVREHERRQCKRYSGE